MSFYVAMIAACLLTTCVLLFIIFKTLKIYQMRKKYEHLPGPRTHGLLGFYLGNLDLAVRIMKQGKVFADLMLELSYVHGKVFKFQILDKMIIFTIDHNAVENVLKKEDFPKIPEIYANVGYPFKERYLGHGLITETDDEQARKSRHLFNPAFHKHVFLNFINDLNTKVDILMERLRSICETSARVTLLDEVNHLVLDTIASVSFGMHVDSTNNADNKLNRYVYESLKGFYRITFDPFLPYKPYEWKFIQNYKKLIRELRGMCKGQILNQLVYIKEGAYLPNHILNNLYNSHVGDIDIDNMVDHFLTMFVAGQETTANTLAFCALELARNPEVLVKLREELDKELGSKSFIDANDLTKLYYTKCVFKETLRLWPPIPEIARITTKDIYIDKYFIPSGSWIQVSSYVSSRYDEYFKEPMKFAPERHFAQQEQESFNKIKTSTSFPFSMGSRNCLGQNFAQMIATIFIAKFVKNFNFEPLTNGNFAWTQEATLRPADGAQCTLSLRSSPSSL